MVIEFSWVMWASLYGEKAVDGPGEQRGRQGVAIAQSASHSAGEQPVGEQEGRVAGEDEGQEKDDAETEERVAGNEVERCGK